MGDMGDMGTMPTDDELSVLIADMDTWLREHSDAADAARSQRAGAVTTGVVLAWSALAAGIAGRRMLTAGWNPRDACLGVPHAAVLVAFAAALKRGQHHTQ